MIIGWRGTRCKARTLVAACALLVSTSFAAAPVTPPKRSAVFVATEQGVLRPGRQLSTPVVQRMVDRLVMKATGKPTPAAAWRSLVEKDDRVGIKVSASGGAISGTNPEVVEAVVAGLSSAGISSKNIIVWDRNLPDLLAAGYRRDSPLYQLRWIDPRDGYDKNAQVSAPVLGKLIWGDSAFGDKAGTRFVDFLSAGDQLSTRSFYSKVLSSQVTKIINIPSLTDSFLTGINGAISNVTLANLDNWRRFTKPPSFGDPYIVELYTDPIIRDKIVFTILDAIVLQYAGGPSANPGFLADYVTLFAGFDPVAIDSTAVRILDEFRKSSKLPSLGPMTSWLQSAKVAGLGNPDESEIDLIPVGTESSSPR
ncbi:MAG: DUF362 domain-containing protein [Terrimicrobiaceae bacterium]